MAFATISYLRSQRPRDARRVGVDYEACELLSESGHLICRAPAWAHLALDAAALFEPEERLAACREHVGHVENFIRWSCGLTAAESVEWNPVPANAR